MSTLVRVRAHVNLLGMSAGEVAIFEADKIRRFMEVGYLVPVDEEGVPMPEELKPAKHRREPSSS